MEISIRDLSMKTVNCHSTFTKVPILDLGKKVKDYWSILLHLYFWLAKGEVICLCRPHSLPWLSCGGICRSRLMSLFIHCLYSLIVVNHEDICIIQVYSNKRIFMSMRLRWTFTTIFKQNTSVVLYITSCM